MIWNSEWYNQCLSARQYIKAEVKKLRMQQETKVIIDYIDRRAKIIQKNQTGMLNSLLNRYKEQLIIDRLVIKDETKTQLIMDPDDILHKCQFQYETIQKT